MSRKFVFLTIFLSIFLLCIPTFYCVTYFNNRVKPFNEELTALKEENVIIEDYNSNDIKVELYSPSFDVTKNYKAQYKVAVYDEQISGTVSNIKVRVALAANWIGFYKVSSEYSVTLSTSEKKLYSSTININNIEDVTKKKNVLVPLPKPTTYLLLTYEVKTNGKTTKHAHVLEYKYGSYKINEGGFAAK